VTGRRLILPLVLVVVLASGFAVGILLSNRENPEARNPSFSPSAGPVSPVPSGKPSKKNPFGVFFNPSRFDAATRVQLAQQLGAHYFRSFPVLLQGWDGQCFDDCQGVAAAGLKYYLTIRNSPELMTAASPVTDIDAYKEAVGRVIQLFKPAVIAVENEENVPGFFSGTGDQYLAELQAACEVAHQMHVLCSNGGLTGDGSTYLAYKHLLDIGQDQQAADYAQNAFADYQLRRLQGPDWETFFSQLIAHIESFTQGYQDAGSDFINFHWYSDNASALADTIRNLQDATGLPAVSNEFATNSTDPQPIGQLMQTVLDLRVQFAVWYSADARIAVALVEPQGQLRASGQAFRDFVRSHFAS
jgi:hypothetical protein